MHKGIFKCRTLFWKATSFSWVVASTHKKATMMHAWLCLYHFVWLPDVMDPHNNLLVFSQKGRCMAICVPSCYNKVGFIGYQTLPYKRRDITHAVYSSIIYCCLPIVLSVWLPLIFKEILISVLYLRCGGILRKLC